MSRSLLLEARYASFVSEMYGKEAKARIKFHEDQKTGRGYVPKTYSAPMPTIDPMQFALRKKREEDKMLAEIVQKARETQVADDMYPVPPDIRHVLYESTSKEGKGCELYLSKRRDQGAPEKRFTFPQVTSWSYGWKVTDDGMTKPRYGRADKIKESFYSTNGLPSISEPSAPGGACCRKVVRTENFAPGYY